MSKVTNTKKFKIGQLLFEFFDFERKTAKIHRGSRVRNISENFNIRLEKAHQFYIDYRNFIDGNNNLLTKIDCP